MTIVVGMSGGLDSTMAAYLLLQDGARVIGVSMQLWDGVPSPRPSVRSGCWDAGEQRDLESAATFAARLGIPHHVIPLAAEYRAEVLEYFRRTYEQGQTPNPCLVCNRRIKFDWLLRKARELGLAFDALATGHYARVAAEPQSGRMLLRRGVDARKDQSYFLARLTQEQLRQAVFPLGELTKAGVRARARALGWDELLARRESQDFTGGADYSALFAGQPSAPGPIVDTTGRRLGEHRGIIHYTIGQRKGLGVGGARAPWYVVRIDAAANTLVVGPREELFARVFTVVDLHWIALSATPTEARRVAAQIRQQHVPAAAVLEPGDVADTVTVTFDEPQMAITPGQFAVFYEGDLVLGSGVIAAVRRNHH